MLRAQWPIAAALSLLACAPVLEEPPRSADEGAHEPTHDRATQSQYAETIDRVSRMTIDEDIVESVRRRRLSIVNVAWEDTGRAWGSAVGPNISDLTLQVRRREGRGYTTALMPVIRSPNFTDRTGDVPRDRFFVRVGNHRDKDLVTVPLDELLGDLRRFAAAPDTLGGEGVAPIDVRAGRDTHYLVSAQAVFLPIPGKGKAEFNPVVFNYQSAPASPAVLAILAAREGTSMSVIENRSESSAHRGSGQELYFNDAGHRASFTAERRSDVMARIAAQGGPKTAADRSALGRGADVMALIQVPLVHEHKGALGGLSSDGYGYEFSDDPLSAGGFGPNDATIRVRPGPMRTDVERAVLGHGPRLGPFFEGWGTRLVRDARFPIRITVQFYKATSNGVVSQADLDGIAHNIESAYAHADYVGSLVLPDRDRARPTAWQKVPGEWFPW